MAEPTYPLELTAAESAALAKVFACSIVAGINERLTEQEPPEFEVALESAFLKLTKLERHWLAEDETDEDLDTIAAFTARLDQKRAELRNREGA